MSPTSPDEHNGWTNRETWAANLWLSNDQGLYSMVTETVADAVDQSRRDAEELELPWNETCGLNRAGEAVKDLVDEIRDWKVADLRNMFDDIGSLWRVEWPEVAAAFIDC